VPALTRVTRNPVLAGGYDPVARAVHWLVAGLAVIVVAFGWAIPEAPRGTESRALLLVLHRSIGLTILGLMLFRALWRARHAPPPLPAELRGLEVALARATHLILYVLFLAMPISGYINTAASGHSVDFFMIGVIPPMIAENDRLAQFALAAHLVGQYLLYLFVALHVAAALMHAVVRRNAVLDRMLPSRRGRSANA